MSSTFIRKHAYNVGTTWQERTEYIAAARKKRHMRFMKRIIIRRTNHQRAAATNNTPVTTPAAPPTEFLEPAFPEDPGAGVNPGNGEVLVELLREEVAEGVLVAGPAVAQMLRASERFRGRLARRRKVDGSLVGDVPRSKASALSGVVAPASKEHWMHLSRRSNPADVHPHASSHCRLQAATQVSISGYHRSGTELDLHRCSRVGYRTANTAGRTCKSPDSRSNGVNERTNLCRHTRLAAE